jgi:hypothetical protein
MMQAFTGQTGTSRGPHRVCVDRLSHVLFLILSCALIRANAADYYLQTSDKKIGKTPDIVGLGACCFSNRAFFSSTTRTLATLCRGCQSGLPCNWRRRDKDAFLRAGDALRVRGRRRVARK